MQYMGSKARHAKELLPIILRDRKPGQWYVEPFVGGANMIDKVDGNRIGNDSHPHLICLLKAVRDGWLPPSNVDEQWYKYAKNKRDLTPETGFIGFLCSFGSKWFGGYARNRIGTNYARTGHNSLLKQAPNLRGIDFRCGSYLDLDIPSDSIIYCDPPYANTTKYATGGFDHIEFWEWCDDKVMGGHKVFVSEYTAPDGWVEVWRKDVTANFDSSRSEASARVEKLFVHHTQVPSE